MATAAFSPSGTLVIPSGGSVDVEVVWTLAPGESTRTGRLSLSWDDGAGSVEALVVDEGAPAETAPTIVLSGSGTGGNALLISDVANIEQLDATHFRLTAK